MPNNKIRVGGVENVEKKEKIYRDEKYLIKEIKSELYV